MEQCLFEGLKLKQKEMVLGNECSLSLFGSILFGNNQIVICHCWSSRRTEPGQALQQGIDDENGLSMLSR